MSTPARFSPSLYRPSSAAKPFLLTLFSLLLAACGNPRAHLIRVSVPEQKMAVYKKGVRTATHTISASRAALGNEPGSLKTPTGRP